MMDFRKITLTELDFNTGQMLAIIQRLNQQHHEKE